MHYWQGNKEEFSEERLIATAKTLFKTCQLSTTNVLPQDYIHTLNPPASILLTSDARRHKVVAVTLWWLEDACFWGVSGHKPCLVGTLVVILLVNASLLPADKSEVSASTVRVAGRSCRASASGRELWISVMIEVVGQCGDSLTPDWVSLWGNSNKHRLLAASSSWSKKITSQMDYLSKPI